MSIFDVFRNKERNSLFNYDEKSKMYTASINNIRFECELLKDNYEELARKLAKNYFDKLDFLVDAMIDEITSFFGEIPKEELIKSLNTPLINLDMSVMSYTEHTFDDVHIIGVEFDGIFDEVFEVSIDG